MGNLRLGMRGEAPCIVHDDTQVYIMFVSPNAVFLAVIVKTPLKANLISHAESSSVRSCEECRQKLSDIFHMPSLCWEKYTENANGFFGCETTRDAGTEGFSKSHTYPESSENDKLTMEDTWALFEYKLLGMDMCYYWLRFNIFTRYLHSTGQSGILLLDMKEFSPFAMQNGTGSVQLTHLGDPFWVYSHILDRVARVSERSVWSIRDQVRSMEKTTGPDYRKLHHDIARHSFHVTETMDATVGTLEHILKSHESLLETKRQSTALYGKELNFEVWEDVHKRLEFFQSYFRNLSHRSTANEKRVHNEIAFAFNMGAQKNSAIAVEDSGTMKTLSLVTLTFLPPTFICAVFSMSFFNYADSGWRVSGKIWIYWAFAIPTTLLSVLIWYGWTKMFPLDRKARGKARRSSYTLSNMI